MFHSGLTSFKTNKITEPWKTTPIPNNPTTTITQSSSCIYENIQTKIKDGNKVFHKKLDIEELNQFAHKELYILNSYSCTQSGLLHCPVVKVEEQKKKKASITFTSTQITPQWRIYILSLYFKWTTVRKKSYLPMKK